MPFLRKTSGGFGAVAVVQDTWFLPLCKIRNSFPSSWTATSLLYKNISSPLHYRYLDNPHNYIQCENKETSKIPIFQLFSELGKIWKTTDQEQISKVWILNPWINRENLCPYLSFSIKNRMGISTRLGTFQTISKTLRIYQWIGICLEKTEFWTYWIFCTYWKNVSEVLKP